MWGAIIGGVASIVGLIFNDSKSSQKQYDAIRTRLQIQSYKDYKEYLQQQNLILAVKSYILPLIAFITLFYLIYKNKI